MHAQKARRYVYRGDSFVEDHSMPITVLDRIMKEISFWLQGDFSRQKTFTPTIHEGPPLRLTLTPKSAPVSDYIASIEILFGETAGVIKSLEIFEKAKDL